MSRIEMLTSIHRATGLSHEAINDVLDIQIAIIVGELKNGRNIRISGIGLFKVVKSNRRKAMNPKTGKVIDVAEKNRLQFKPCTEIKEAINPK